MKHFLRNSLIEPCFEIVNGLAVSAFVVVVVVVASGKTVSHII